jgi:very-short-patch-repair endonuclease
MTLVMLAYKKYLKPHAQKLRLHMTDAERKLWNHMKGKQILAIQFYRQKPIGPYIVDFHAPKIKLVIEIDGSQHDDTSHKKSDNIRDQYLKNLGLFILRFNSRETLQNIDGVLDVIFRYANEQGKSP